MTIGSDTSVGEVVARDFRAAAVFHRYGIDFCCGGKKTVAQACGDRGLRADVVLGDVEQACTGANADAPRFHEWDPDTLIAYIVGNHHAYVRRALPVITAHTQKVASAHGARHPELREVASLWANVAAEMTAHMAKEEVVLFPYIALAAAAVRRGDAVPPAPFGSIENPVRVMEHEHDTTGDAIAQIRGLTNGYAVPQDACTTYRICLKELEEFELDLHTHVHLENNLLFPTARTLASATASRT